MADVFVDKSDENYDGTLQPNELARAAGSVSRDAYPLVMGLIEVYTDAENDKVKEVLRAAMKYA